MNKPLTIGIDIRDLKKAKTGTKTYLEELCREFKLLESDQYHFKFLDTSLPVYTGTSKIGKYIEHFLFQYWKQAVLPLKACVYGCDILFCTDNFVPLIRLGYQTVPVFHDAFFFEEPASYGKLWLKLYHLTAMPAARKAAFIVTPSRYAQQQIHQYTGIPLSSLKVIYEGPKSMEVNDSDNIFESFAIEQGNYILHTGSMYQRKNIPALIQAFKLLKSETGSTIKLVLAGAPPVSAAENDFNPIKKAIVEAGLDNEVIITGYLNDAALASAYANAFMYVFPSLNEGFGIPVLEAFKYKLPVLVADNTSLPEVGGNAVLTFNPFNTNDMYLKIKSVLQNDSIREDLISKGQLRLDNFSWLKTAKELLILFEKHTR